MLGRAIGRSENEKWHRLFARNFQGIAYQATVDLEPVFVGGAVETITGYTADEFLTGTVRWDAVVHPDDLPRLQEEIDSLQAIRGSSVDRIYRILRRDDTVRWIRDLVWNVCGDDGTPVLIQGVIQDVTDRKQKNEGLLSANRQLQVLNQIMGVSASSLSLDELLETSLIKTLDLLDFDVGLTYLVNPERTTALIRSHHMVPGKYLSRNRVIKIHHWPWNFIFIAGQPRYIELRNRPGTVEGGSSHHLRRPLSPAFRSSLSRLWSVRCLSGAGSGRVLKVRSGAFWRRSGKRSARESSEACSIKGWKRRTARRTSTWTS